MQWPNSVCLVSPDNKAATNSPGDGPKLQAACHLANYGLFPFQGEKSVALLIKEKSL